MYNVDCGLILVISFYYVEKPESTRCIEKRTYILPSFNFDEHIVHNSWRIASTKTVEYRNFLQQTDVVLFYLLCINTT